MQKAAGAINREERMPSAALYLWLVDSECIMVALWLIVRSGPMWGRRHPLWFPPSANCSPGLVMICSSPGSSPAVISICVPKSWPTVTLRTWAVIASRRSRCACRRRRKPAHWLAQESTGRPVRFSAPPGRTYRDREDYLGLSTRISYCILRVFGSSAPDLRMIFPGNSCPG